MKTTVKNIFLPILLSFCVVSAWSQGGNDPEIDSLKQTFLQRTGQFFDVKMLDHSVETRRMVKKGVHESLNEFEDKTNGQLVLALKSELSIDEVWPNILNRKKYYSTDGKYVLDATFGNGEEGKYFIALNIDVDTLDSREEYAIEIVGNLNPDLEEFLEEKEITGLKGDIDDHFLGYFDEEIYSHPGEAPVDEAIIELLELLDLKLGDVYSELQEMQGILDNVSETFEDAREDFQVVFSPAENLEYGFDVYQYVAWIDYYDFVALGDGFHYKTPVQSVEKGEAVVVKALLIDSIGTHNSELVSFEATNGATMTWELQGEYYLVTINNTDKSQFIYAKYDGKKLGKLQLESYQKKQEKVVVIPVNQTLPISESALEEYLNTIYQKSIVEWDVSIADNWTNTTWDSITPGQLEEADATLMTKYSSEMRKLRNTYFDENPTIENGCHYLFVVNDFTKEDLQGYMVRGRSLGFIKNTDALSFKRTVGHELGHGAFGLRHTFNQNKFVGEMTQVNSIMDYSSSTHLSYPEWKAIHDWKPINSLFDEEEDAEGVYITMDIPYEYRNSDSTITVLTPTNRLITLPRETSYLRFFTADPLYYSSTGAFSGNYGPIGTLAAFKVRSSLNEVVEYKLNKQGGNLYYKKKDTEIKYIDSLSTDVANFNLLTAFPFRENKQFQLQIYNLGTSDVQRQEVSARPDSGIVNFGNGQDSFGGTFSVVELVYGVEAANQENIESLPMQAGTTYIELNGLAWKNVFDIQQGYTIAGGFYPELSGLSIEYLDYFSSYTKVGHPAAPIVISNAVWVQKMELIEPYIKCAVSTNTNTPQNDPIGPPPPYALDDGFLNSSSLNVYNPGPGMFEPMEEWSSPPPIDQYNGSDLGKAVRAYREFKYMIDNLILVPDMANGVNNKIANTTEGNDTQLEELIEKLNQTPICIFEEITVPNRIKAIKLLEPENEEELIIKLFSSTLYNGQMSALADALFENNADLFDKLWWRLDFTEFHQWINSVTQLILVNNMGQEVTESVDFSISTRVTVEWQDNGKIKIGNRYLHDYGPYGALTQNGTIYSGYATDYHEYDYDQVVNFTFAKDGFIDLGDAQEDIMTLKLPAFYIGYLVHNKDTKAVMTLVRVVVDIAAIVAAIPTGGGSIGAAAAFSAVLAGADLIVLMSEDAIKNNFEQGEEFLELWNYITMLDIAVAIPQIGKGITKVIDNIPIGTIKFEVNIANLIDRMVYHMNQLRAQGKNLATTHYKELIEKFRVIATKLANAGESVYSIMLRTKLLLQLEAEYLRALYAPIYLDDAFSIVNDIEGIITRAGQQHHVFYLKTSSQGLFVNSPVLAGVPGNGTFFGKFDDIRYKFGAKVEEGDLFVYKVTDGTLVVTKYDALLSYSKISDLPESLKDIIRMKSFDGATLAKLEDDLASSTFKSHLVGDPQLLDGWKLLADAPSLRVDIRYLRILSGDISSLGYTVDDIIAHGTHSTTQISDGVMLSNPTVNGILQDLINQGKLNWVEASSIFRYTYYNPITNIGGSGLVNPVISVFPEKLAAGRILDNALQKFGDAGYYIPDGTITTRGGCYTSERMLEDFIQPYQNNVPTTLPVVLSSSMDNAGDVAKKFIDHTYDGTNIRTIITIKTKQGVYVDDIAHWGSNFNAASNPGISASPLLPHPQLEVLQMPGKQYRITSIVDDLNSSWYPGELLKRITLEEL